MNRIKAFCLGIVLCLSLSAQTEEKSGLRSFRVFVPDAEIVQGDLIQIAYELHATNWSVTSFDGSMDCAELKDLDNSKKYYDDGTGTLRVLATYRILGSGHLTVHSMSATVDGKTVVSDSTAIDVSPHPKYGRQWHQASAFLESKGVVAPYLAYKYGTETSRVFSDDRTKCFVITVSEEYEKYLDSPILAYGIGNNTWDGEKTDHDNTIYSIIDLYHRQLKYLAADKAKYSPAHSADHKEAQPLLGAIAYSQRYPYNRYFPKEKIQGKDTLCITGCGPVALAQVLTYYHNPVSLMGDLHVSTKSGKRYRIDTSDYPVNWDGSEKDIASLLIDCAGSLGTELSPTASSSYLSDFKPALISIWGFSPQCRMREVSNCHDALSQIYREIDQGRPVIVSDDSHIFIIDGYNDDFLHLNLGWGGYCNGYYRTLVTDSMKGNQLPFESFLTGIGPLENELELSVNVSEPGTLSDLLGDNILTVTSLAVSGTIDGDDIQCLRKMAGADAQESGSLMYLDLSKAEFEGGSYYLTRSADGITISGYQSDERGRFDYKYSMSDVTEDDWNVIVSRGLQDLENKTLSRGSDGNIYVSYMTVENVISDHMFSDCENLIGITLPKKTSQIGNYAFHNCKALKTVSGKPSTVSKNAFQNSGMEK